MGGSRGMRRLCTICVRGGSKGVPNKNIKPLLGKPLLVYSIEHARQCGLFERIAVSSDSEAILAVARDAGVDDLVERPPQLATDTAAKAPAILHALTTVEHRSGIRFDTLVDLDATSPLRILEDVVGAVELLEHTGSDSVITGARSHRSPYFNLVEESANGSVKPSKELDVAPVRRQDVPRTFDMNASIYVWRAETFRNDPRVFYASTRLFEMPQERSVDIDAPLDLEIVEMILRRRSTKEEAKDAQAS
jgi:CMP-N,N'-diacetyllegionaminic acid synthase